jgi:hypothetical protein
VVPDRVGLIALGATIIALPAQATVISVSPADGNTAYTKIEAASPGDEVIIAPGTYVFRVYLTGQGTTAQPIYIHSQDPSNPAIWDLSGVLVDNVPGSYTAPDKARGCWQFSGASNYHLDGIIFQNIHATDGDSAGIRYYNGTTGLLITNCLFQNNDEGLTGGTAASNGTQSEATVEFSEFNKNGDSVATDAMHNIYIYGGIFTMRYSYIHDALLNENLHCRAVTSTIEYNWFSRAAGYAGDLMTNDDYANNPVGSVTQTMTFRGNVIYQGNTQCNDSQIWALYNDAASGKPVTFQINMLYNTLVGARGHANFIHVSNADGTQMSATVSNNIIYGTSEPILVEDSAAATVSGVNNWIQTGATAPGITGSVTGCDPGFNDLANFDFTLAPGSAGLGAANTGVGGLPIAEYYKNETLTRMYRVRLTANDLGAFEHTTTGPGIGPYGTPDGGTADAGSSASDAGSTDAGSPDAGSATRDSGSSGTAGDAGGLSGTSSCGCASTENSWTLIALIALVVGFTRQRRLGGRHE